MDELIGGIIELILEGSCDLVNDKKVPMPIRIICLFVVGIFFIGVIGLFLILGINLIMDGNVALACFVFALDLLFLGIAVYIIRKFRREMK